MVKSDYGVIFMLDSKKIAKYLAEKRKSRGMTQQQTADAVNVSFQAVSKWESGVAYPSIELLYELALLYGTTVDEILNAKDSDSAGLSYTQAGIDITYTDAIKKEMSEYLVPANPRVLNGLGAFASLYDIKFDEIEHPVLVMKAEEPGSKQKLALQYGYTGSICHDMINHLVNDIIVMGARPLAVLDTIICGNAEKDTIKALVKGISEACKNNECELVGGETSIQPGVVDSGVYILTATVAGIVEKSRIIDGAKIKPGDKILAIASNGLHTNGYSLVRLLMEQMPRIKDDMIGDETFLEAIMRPHRAYYGAVKDILPNSGLHGMAHITGGGIEGNLPRILPDGSGARIDLGRIKIPQIFAHIKANGNVSDDEMLRTFNCGVGMILVVEGVAADEIMADISRYWDCYEIGEIAEMENKVEFHGRMDWRRRHHRLR